MNIILRYCIMITSSLKALANIAEVNIGLYSRLLLPAANLTFSDSFPIDSDDDGDVLAVSIMLWVVRHCKENVKICEDIIIVI